ncbi:MAG: hypothetical protein RLZZ385_1311 [Pseudomonadota bacterium]|jgi:DNA-binding MarR family transcriptional regulator
MKNSEITGFGFCINDVARLMRWSFDRQSQELGLTRAQWSVLAHLKRSNGVQQQALARLMDIKPITLARHIDRLEKEGWVERRDDPADRRAKRLYLTDAAAPMLDSLRRLGEKVRRQALQGISAEDEAHAMRVLTRMRDNLSSPGND